MTIDEEYKGCRNCKYQPEPLQNCDWIKHQKKFYRVCPMWELKESDVKMTIDEAIEIVKQGGVTDDVCEWKYNDTEYYWESSCDHLHIFMADGPKENEYMFCPYCGKKIKVVE